MSGWYTGRKQRGGLSCPGEDPELEAGRERTWWWQGAGTPSYGLE